VVLVDSDMDTPLMAEVSDAEDSPFHAGSSGASRATIFIPRDSPVLAGMNNVVTPFLLMTVRWG
jgi:hypothetical protein